MKLAIVLLLTMASAFGQAPGDSAARRLHAEGTPDQDLAFYAPMDGAQTLAFAPATGPSGLTWYTDESHRCLTYMLEEPPGHCVLRIAFPKATQIKCGAPKVVDDVLEIECSYDLPGQTEAEWIEQLVLEQHEAWEADARRCWRRIDWFAAGCEKYQLDGAAEPKNRPY